MEINTAPAATLPKAVEKPAVVRAAPEIPVFQRPDVITTIAVMVQTTIVSKNTSNIPHRPCLTGWLTDAEE